MDLEFLDHQMEQRKMVMGKQDENYKKRYQKKVDKIQKEEDRLMRWQMEKEAAATKRKVDYHHDDDDDDGVLDQDFVPPSTKQSKPQYIPALIPRRILASDQVCQMADRNATSYSQEVGNVASVLQAAKAPDGSALDMDQFVLSKKTALRERKGVRQDFNENFYKGFEPPKHTACHWDEKFCKTVLGQEFGQGHIAVLLSGEKYEEGILVEMSGLPDGEGMTLANVCYEAILKCRCQENVKVMVFDTTSSNTGIHRGGATILERDKLCRKLIWAACR